MISQIFHNSLIFYPLVPDAKSFPISRRNSGRIPWSPGRTAGGCRFREPSSHSGGVGNPSHVVTHTHTQTHTHPHTHTPTHSHTHTHTQTHTHTHTHTQAHTQGRRHKRNVG